ncbi:ATP-dependent helicase C-terminal domain-containing protein [Algoriphagus namhaensis]
MPCHPRLAHLLLEAEKINCLELATDLAALLEERDPLGPESGVDINLRIEALRRWRKEGLGSNRLKRIDKVAAIYRNMMKVEPSNSAVDPWQTGLLLAFAYPERIAAARPGNNAQFQLANGSIAQIGHRDDLAYESWLAVAHVDAREGLGKIWLAAPINPKDLMPLLKSKEIVRWDRKQGGFIAETELRIGAIILGKRPLHQLSDESKTKAILDAVRSEGEFLLDWNEQVHQLLYRVQSLRHWNPNQNWPEWTVESLKSTAERWLSPYLAQAKKNEDLMKLDLKAILLHSLTFEDQKLLESLAPSKIEVPSGSQISIQYAPNGDTPRISVRLQEVFGLTETPRVKQGKIPVLMELLSPGFKPVQLTQDLKSFWSNGYFEVRKELKRRYPKHEWPENPLEAQAVRGVKKRP